MVTPLEVFCCYAREDQEMLTHLKTHLAPLVRQGQITIWSDTNLNAGVEWEKELHQHLESADIILLLISPDFMASDYCYSTEMGRALVRHNEGSAVVIPMLLRSTFWQNAPFANLQVVPTNAKPVTNWSNRDDGFHDITMQVNQVILELQTKRTQVEADEPTITRERQTSDQKTPLASQNPLAAGVRSQPPIAIPPRALAAKPEVLFTLTGHTSSVESVALSANGLILASGGYDKTIKLWNAKTGQLLHTLTGHTESVTSVVLSADGRTLASGSWDKCIKLWSVQTGQLLHTLKGHSSAVGVALSADGRILVSDSRDHTIKLWNGQTGQLLRTLDDNGSYNCSIALSADGLILANLLSEQVIRLWNVQTSQFLRVIRPGAAKVNSIALSVDGLILAGGCWDHTIKLWNTQTGQLLRTLKGCNKAVNGVALSADGLIVGSCYEQPIKLWNGQTGQLLYTFQGPNPKTSVNSIALSADGLTLAAGDLHQTINIWGVKK